MTDEVLATEPVVDATPVDVTPEPVAQLQKEMPKSYAELLKVRQTLEKHFKDVQDI